MMRKPRVRVISTGGTISTQPDPASGRLVAHFSGQSLLERVPDFGDVDVEVEQYCNVLSFALSLPMAYGLAKRVNQALASGQVDGVVITHGTACLEESVFLVDLLLDSDKPAVATGAMYSASAADADGPRNIARSIRVAAAPEARGQGAMVCFDGDIHAARDVIKVQAFSVHAYTSYEHGALGHVDDEKVYFFRRPLRRLRLAAPGVVEEVDVIYVTLGMDDRLLRAAIASGARGVVIAGLPGHGAVPPGVLKGIETVVAHGIPVLYTSRGPIGRVSAIHYGGGGGALDIADAGAIFAGDLQPAKARILLSLLLAEGRNAAGIREAVATIAP